MRSPCIGILLTGLLVVAAALNFRGGDPQPLAGPEKPADSTSPATPSGEPLERRAVLPEGVSETAESAGLPTGTGTLRIRASHAYDGIPAVNMNLQVSMADAGETLRGVTNGQGEAVFSPIAQGEQFVTNDRGDRAVSVTIHAGRETTIDYHVQRGIRVHGRVIDSTGRPLAGAAIKLFAAGGGEPSYVIDTTAHDGTFQAFDLPSDRQLNVHLAGYCSVIAIELQKLTPGKPVDFVLSPGAATVEGFLSAPGGLPIAGAEVTIVAITRGEPDVVVRSDETGRFKASGVRPGLHNWRAVASGYDFNRGKCWAVAGQSTQLTITLTAELLGKSRPFYPGSFGSSHRVNSRRW